MTYDPTQVAASILVDGVDLRQAFGFESLEPVGRTSLALQRRTHQLPFDHGVRSQGGTYRARTIAVRGWMPKANLYKLSRFLFNDTGVPGRSKKRRSIIFMDNSAVEYTFDTVEAFSERERTRRWVGTLYVDVNFSIVVTGAFGRHAGVSQHGVYSPRVYSGTGQGASSASPAFIQLHHTGGKAARTHEDMVIKLGKALTPKLVSCRTGLITNFNAGLKAIDNEGATFDGAMYAPTEILTNPDFENDDIVTGWTSFGGHTISAPWGGLFGNAGYTDRIPTGSVVRHGLTNQTDSGFRQDHSTVAARQYTVRVEVYIEGSLGTCEIIWGKAGTAEELVKHTVTSSMRNRWVFVEFTMESLSTEDYRITLNFPASGTSYYVNKVSVVESDVLNGSFEGTFVAGVAPGWEVSNLTAAEETTTVYSTGASTARKAQKVTYVSASNYLRPTADITIQDDRIYYLCGWVRRESGAANLIIENSAANASVPCSDQIKLTTGKWVRFTTFFDTFSSKSSLDSDVLRPNFKLSGAGVVIFDDVALHELTTSTDIHFEPGPFGKRLQVPVGRVVLFDDAAGANSTFINSYNFTLACHFLPTYIDDFGAPMIARVSDTYEHDAFVRWDDDAPGASITVDGDGSRAFLKLEGDTSTSGADFQDFQGGHRGTRGLVFKYDGGALLVPDWEAKLFFERTLELVNGSVLQGPITPESNIITPVTFPVRTSYRRILLGDVGHWDAFWCYQYGMDDERSAGECVAMYPPKHDNKVFDYGANILAGEELIIDLERGTVELNDGAGVLTNQFANVTGSLPELGADAPVLLVADDINAIQILGKGTV